MTREQTENLTSIAIRLGQAKTRIKPNVLSTNLCKLQKLAISLHKRYENMCNYAWASGEKYDDQTECLQRRAGVLAEEIGVTVRHQQDPRGAPMYLTIGESEYVLF